MTDLVRAFMLSWFLGHGYQPFQAEALIRQAQVESGLKPQIIRHTGACLFQWSGVRRRTLLTASKTCPPLGQQLAYADRELRTLYSCFWSTSPNTAYTVLRATFGRGLQCDK